MLSFGFSSSERRRQPESAFGFTGSERKRQPGSDFGSARFSRDHSIKLGFKQGPLLVAMFLKGPLYLNRFCRDHSI